VGDGIALKAYSKPTTARVVVGDAAGHR